MKIKILYPKCFHIFWFNLSEFFKCYLKCDSINKLEKVDVLLARHDNDCGYKFNNLYYSPLVDSMIDLLNKYKVKHQTIGSGYCKIKSEETYSKALYFNFIFFFISLLKRSVHLFIGIDNATILRYKLKTAFWKVIIQKTSPKFIVGVEPEPEFCAAAHACNIKIYDLQHGLISTDISPYFKKLARNKKTDGPSGIFCWDTNSLLNRKSWTEKYGFETIETGNPWFERFRVADPSDKLVSNALEGKPPINSGKLNILLSLQPNLKDLHYRDIVFDGLIFEELKSIIIRREDINWHIRLHPTQLKSPKLKETWQYLQNLFADTRNVEWINASSWPLPVILKSMDLHITDSSSVTIEAGWYGIHSALLNAHIKSDGPLLSLFKSELARGHAEVIDRTVESIEQWINDKINEKSFKIYNENDKVNKFEKYLKKLLLENKILG